MARRRRITTREDLLHRYATVRGLTYGEAHDAHHATPLEDLAAIVRRWEAVPRVEFSEARRSWAAQHPTTTVDGVTR